MTSAEIRQSFLDFFKSKGHTLVPSASLMPDSPNLLFTNAGMNQFVPIFLGQVKCPYTPGRAADTQKCIRAGGKHNDLEDVGLDTYHHTFFEMLGNWSFGDYFKKEAIAWAWELLTQVWGLDRSRLYATYFGGDEAEHLEPDLEARDLWAAVMRADGLDASHVVPGDKQDNFWEMGATGPCGPCSEIHIDLTPDKSGGPLVNAGDARVIEIWNLVFIQFNRAPDGKLTPLPARHVDTGMGFERVTAVLQGHNNNYATDVFVPIIQAIEKLSGHTYGGNAPSPSEREAPASAPSNPERQRGAGTEPDRQRGAATEPGAQATGQHSRYAAMRPGNAQDEACRVIADHIRTLTFALTDGCVPDREGRGYVLRRILRRAVRFGWQYLNLHEPFLCKLVDTVVEVMGEAFPELRKNPPHVREVLREEEESFGRTLADGLALFEHAVAQLVAEQRARETGRTLLRVVKPAIGPAGPEMWEAQYAGIPRGTSEVFSTTATGATEFLRIVPQLPGDVVFRLHDTYGLDKDLTQIMAQEKGLTVDTAEYERLMEEARERSRSTAKHFLGALGATFSASFGPTDDNQKYSSTVTQARIKAILRADDRGAGLIDATAMVVGEDTLVWDEAAMQAHVGKGEPLPPGRRLKVEGATAGANVAVILDRTCFYAESGGQVGDTGSISTESGGIRVENTLRFGDLVVHFGFVSAGHVRFGQECAAQVDDARAHTMKNHTATHVLNWALREVLGEHVQQKGSLVDPDKTRFDFAHPKALTLEEIERVETLVNERIARKLPVHWQEVPQEQALKINGLRAVFGERYPDIVRVLSVGASVDELVNDPDNPKWRDVSVEFCGGTHVRNTGEIEHFVLISEEAVAKGIRRVVGLTGQAARVADECGAALVQRAQEPTKPSPADVSTGLAELQNTLTTATIPVRHRARLRELMEELQHVVKQQQKAHAADAGGVVRERVAELLAQAEKIGDTTVVVGEMPDVPVEQLKHGADTIKQKCGSAAVLLGMCVAASEDGKTPAKAMLLAAFTDDLVKRGLKAGDLVKTIAPIVEGGGGGPPTMAQAGGKKPDKLAEALEAGRQWIRGKLA